jgi:hypothetical protein
MKTIFAGARSTVASRAGRVNAAVTGVITDPARPRLKDGLMERAAHEGKAASFVRGSS